MYHYIDDITQTSDSLTELECATPQLLAQLRVEDGQSIPKKSRDLDCLSDSWVLFGQVRQR